MRVDPRPMLSEAGGLQKERDAPCGGLGVADGRLGVLRAGGARFRLGWSSLSLGQPPLSASSDTMPPARAPKLT